MRAPDKNSRARANYSGAFLSILRAVAFCTRVFVKLKTSGTVYSYTVADDAGNYHGKIRYITGCTVFQQNTLDQYLTICILSIDNS